MDFVNRLKTYMNSESISSTQFADACRIPRPTLSQILSGRNKKISDEVIGKIHEAYPSLNVMWLLFGEGTMKVEANNEISEPQNVGFIDFSGPQSTENVHSALSGNDNGDLGVFDPENSGTQSIIDFDAKDDAAEPDFGRNGIQQTVPTTAGSTPRQISISADGSKSILNITVFYSDNSFQLFVPANK